MLGAQPDLAAHAFLVDDFGQTGSAELHDALVVAEEIFGDAGAQAVAPGIPLGELRLIFGGDATGIFLLFFDLGSFGLQLGFGGFHILVARLDVDHDLEDAIFVNADFLFGELDLMEERFVLIVGLDVEGLVAVLGDFALEILDGRFELLFIGFVGFGGGASLFQVGLGAGELLLDGCDTFGEFGDLLLQLADLLIRSLEL